MPSNHEALEETLSLTVAKICPYCNKDFELIGKYPRRDPSILEDPSRIARVSSLKRIHCSQSCAAKSNLKQRSDMSNPWTEEELNKLKSWIGKKPLAQVQREWKKLAKRNKWEDRSDEAIHVKFGRLCRELGVTEKAIVDNLSTIEVARQLGVPNDRVRAWRRNGLKYQEYSWDGERSHIIAISRKDLRSFAAAHPEEFWGIDPKYLSKLFGDAKLAKAIAATVEQPTVGRAITVVRLDTGDVYRSARDAACTLKILKSNVLRSSHRGTPMRNGMDFAQLDYPIYWVPLVYRDEFNKLAGGLLYDLYQSTRELTGATKVSCLIVAGRIAVQIALFAFRRNLKEGLKGLELTPHSVTVFYWSERMLTTLSMFFEMNQSSCWTTLTGAIKRRAYKTFASYFGYQNSKQVQSNLEDFASHFIQETTKNYYKTSYLPVNYQPKTKLETADLFTYIYGSILAKVEIRRDYHELLCRVLAWKYLSKNFSYKERLADLSGNEVDESERPFNQKVQQATIDSSPPDQLLEDLLAFIEAQPMNEQERDRLTMYVAMKLEDATNREIASTLGVSEVEVMAVEHKLKQLAAKWRGDE